VGAEDRDLDSITSAATLAVFHSTSTDAVPILSVTRLAQGGGDDAGGASGPSPAGSSLNIK
jgi:hypothetical protein